MLERVLEIMSRVLDVPIEQLNKESTSGTVENWDSLGHFNFVFELEHEFKVSFADEELIELRSIKAVVEMLKLKMNTKGKDNLWSKGLIDKASQQSVTSVRECLRRLGIAPGETIYLHSDAIVVAQFAGQGNHQGINILIDEIEDYLGEKGTLILPTYTYSFTKNEIYDVLKTPSCVGLITEIFRQRPGVMRSPDPIFSIAASGKNKNLYVECDPFECLGQGSSFEMLHKNSGWVVGMGCSFNRATFVHYVEKVMDVDYRYEKQFAGQRILHDGLMQNWEISYYVRDLSRKSDIELKKLQAIMIKNKTLKKDALDRISTWAAKSSDIFDNAAALLMEQSNSLIEEGN